MKYQKNLSNIEGLYVIEPETYGDERGYFLETYSYKDLLSIGIEITFVQDNQSGSVKNVLRGLHYQNKYPQAKLVRVIKGEVFDVAVDLRPNSPTYKKWHAEILSDENKKQFFIPAGFAHGFLVLSDKAEFCYKCDRFYHPEDECGIIWNDPQIAIDWPIKTDLIISKKDQNWPKI